MFCTLPWSGECSATVTGSQSAPRAHTVETYSLSVISTFTFLVGNRNAISRNSTGRSSAKRHKRPRETFLLSGGLMDTQDEAKVERLRRDTPGTASLVHFNNAGTVHQTVKLYAQYWPFQLAWYR